MNAALLQPIAESPQTLSLVPPSAQSVQEESSDDRHPLLPVFVAGAIAAAGALLFVGSILAWLTLRFGGISATW